MTILALIGKGNWGNKYLEIVKKIPDCKIKYIKTRDYKDLLNYSDIDGIILATPDSTHVEIINTFPTSYLLVEKPFVTSLKDANRIFNKKIMVGYTYLYDKLLFQRIKRFDEIKNLTFQIKNVEKVKGTTPVWYLASHGVALSYYLRGKPEFILAVNIKNNILVNLIYDSTVVNIEVGWNYSKKDRLIAIDDIDLTTIGTTQKIEPLENQLRTFISFIHGGRVKTGLRFAKNVTAILQDIENLLTFSTI